MGLEQDSEHIQTKKINCRHTIEKNKVACFVGLLSVSNSKSRYT